MTNSSTHLAFIDGTSSAAAQFVVDTTAPADSLASRTANLIIAETEIHL